MDAERELRESVTETRRALKGLQRQARQVLELATDLDERLAAREASTNRTAIGGTANEHNHPETRREGVTQLARRVA